MTDSGEILRQAASFVTTESGFQCSIVTAAQLSAATRRLEAKVSTAQSNEDEAFVAPEHGRRGGAAIPKKRALQSTAAKTLAKATYAR